MSLPSEPVQVSTSTKFKVNTGQYQVLDQEKSQVQLEESKFKQETENELRIPVFITKDASKVIALSRLYTEAFRNKRNHGKSNENNYQLEEAAKNSDKDADVSTHGYISNLNERNDEGHLPEPSVETFHSSHQNQHQSEDEENFLLASPSTLNSRVRGVNSFYDELDDPIVSGSEENISCLKGQNIPRATTLESNKVINTFSPYYSSSSFSDFTDDLSNNNFYTSTNTLEPSESRNTYEIWTYPGDLIENEILSKEKNKHVATKYIAKVLNTYFNFILEFRKHHAWPKF